MNDKLKPCPFCGGKAALYVNDGIRVICEKCRSQSICLCDGLDAKGVVGNATRAVIEAWNRRATE